MTSATKVERSSRGRRAWYAAYRARRVFWHALIREGAARHTAYVVVALTLAALLLVRLTSRRPGMPDAVVNRVLAAGAVVGLAILVHRFRRAWRMFPDDRRAERKGRRSELFSGGITHRRYQRWLWVSDNLPFVVIGGVVAVIAVERYPGRDGRAILLCIVGVTAGYFISMGMRRWSRRRFWPRTWWRLCPRCGYDMKASPERCPECGLRRIV